MEGLDFAGGHDVNVFLCVKRVPYMQRASDQVSSNFSNSFIILVGETTVLANYEN